MKKVLVLFFSFLTGFSFGQDSSLAGQVRQLEARGSVNDARALLQQAVQQQPGNASTAFEWAEFLDRYGDPAARAAYEKAITLGPDSPRKKTAARRLALLDLLAGDDSSARKRLPLVGSSSWSLPEKANSLPGPQTSTIEIPGPIRSFSRMAALSPDLSTYDVLGALARNVVTNGYQAANSSEALDQTEFLKLVVRYLTQAREISKLANSDGMLKIDTCESPQTGELLKVLGYRMRGGCGAEVVLETVNASRAFLTIDSGFPLAELEQALRTNRPFEYDYSPTKVTVLYTPDYWLTAKEKEKYPEFIDAFLSDPSLCRLYLAMSKLDPATAEELRENLPVQRIKAFSHILDFFGGMITLRNGKIPVPGGARSAGAWAELAGANPDQGVAFLEKLISRDDGWLASYYDSLSRVTGPAQDYLTEPTRLKRFYAALRGKVTSPGPARPVFRSNTELMLLTTRLRADANGKPHIPGGLEVWKQLFIKHPHGKYDGKLTKAAAGWKDPDDLMEALFGLCRKAVENEPLKMFMAVTDINRRRGAELQPTTVDRLLREYRNYSSQYPIFAEVNTLSDATILQYIDTAEAISDVRDQSLRADVAGTAQSLISLWQIFYRQASIKPPDADKALTELLTPFAKIRNQRELFDAGRGGVATLMKYTGIADNADPHERFLDLLAGTANPTDVESHEQLVRDMIRIYELQKLPSLKLLFDVADNLEAAGKGEKLNTALLNRLGTRLSDIQVPRASMTTIEKNSMAFGYWTERHIERQRKLNLRSLTEKAGSDAEKLADIRGQLAPVLRDSLVGLNYVHYAPPGAQILQTNPIFVRSHDFLGLQGSVQTWRQTEVFGTGWPSSAGGRLVGSLSGLPYALAEAEQNFLIPSREQALIWGDLVPQMILMAKVPRFWNVTPAQLHWVGLHMRLGESLLAEGALDAKIRDQVIATLDQRAAPGRVRRVEMLLGAGLVPDALEQTTPAELYLLASDLQDKIPAGPLNTAIRELAQSRAADVSEAAISRAFGTPKPTLANSYHPELLNLRTFPTLMGYSSRIMAESWESNILYYAALADQLRLRPSQLNVRVPEWTQKTVESIFATHLEDWPALLRSLRTVGAGALAEEARAASSVAGGLE